MRRRTAKECAWNVNEVEESERTILPLIFSSLSTPPAFPSSYLIRERSVSSQIQDRIEQEKERERELNARIGRRGKKTKRCENQDIKERSKRWKKKRRKKERREESENGGKGANEGEALKKKQVRGTK